METNKETLRQCRRRTLRMIKDFHYPDEIRKRIEKAETITQIGNILRDAREAYL